MKMEKSAIILNKIQILVHQIVWSVNFFKGVDLIENWCKCDIYSAFAEVELLKKENDSRFNYIVKLTKEIELI